MCKLVRIKGKKTSLRRARTVYECLRRGRTVYESQIVNHSAYTPGRMGHILGRNGYYRTHKKKVCMDQFKCACLICKWGWEILFKKRKGLWRNPRHLEARIVRPLYVAFQRSLHSLLCFFCRIRSISNKVKLQMSEGVVWKG